MAKSTSHNMCRRALLNGKNVCRGKDLLTECENWCRDLNTQNVTKGCLDTNSIKKSVWEKNEDNLKILVMNEIKIQDRYSDDRVERDYIKHMSPSDRRIWFGRRSRMTLRIKANRSSVFRVNMGCRYCKTDLIENQEQLETCTGFTHEQIFWRRMAPKLKKINDEDKYIALKEKLRLKNWAF